MKELAVINPENVTEEEVKKFSTREAARAIVIDNDGLLGMLYVSDGDYYKIPGGGLEENEDQIKALERECLEEIGCNIDVISEIGSVLEYRKIFNLKQTSFCYLAKVKGEKGTPSFTQKERDRGFKVVWLTYEEAINSINKSVSGVFEAREYMVPRDKIFLTEAKKYLINLKS